jgi:hypothetical protein
MSIANQPASTLPASDPDASVTREVTFLDHRRAPADIGGATIGKDFEHHQALSVVSRAASPRSSRTNRTASKAKHRTHTHRPER